MRAGPALRLRPTSKFLLWLSPTVEKFPRSQKFLLELGTWVQRDNGFWALRIKRQDLEALQDAR
jgi:hypothetical protein